MSTVSNQRGSATNSLEYGDQLRTLQGSSLRDFLENAEDVSGINFNFDSVKFESLAGESLAQTRKQQYDGELYSKIVLAADPQLKNMSKSLRNHALIHEGVHSLQFEGKLCEKLLEEELSEEEVRQLQLEMGKNETRLEGATEVITHFLDPDSQKVGRRFYPDEMALVESELEEDSEIAKDIKNTKNSIIAEYKQVYEVEVNEGIYREKGVFNGEAYDAVVLGDSIEDYGEEIVNQYLEHRYSEGEYQESVELSTYDSLDAVGTEEYVA
ncbi:MAG: hypothetical protein J07AB43_06080 [Candidatus Nanosalina sp. J07AB43]|nr:MAG: hypothetical protein J07AB43_06080 [Candidatus Nanosalina sp. J07AB43]